MIGRSQGTPRPRMREIISKILLPNPGQPERIAFGCVNLNSIKLRLIVGITLKSTELCS